MATDRQIAANRLNSKKSTGPKSVGGKRRAGRNARIHGLAGRSPVDPHWIAMVEQRAREIVDSTDGRIDLAHARLIAETEQELIRARSVSNVVVANLCAAYLAGDRINRSKCGTLKTWETQRSTQLTLLRLLDRYEHRALAKRNKAIRLCFEE